MPYQVDLLYDASSLDKDWSDDSAPEVDIQTHFQQLPFQDLEPQQPSSDLETPISGTQGAPIVLLSSSGEPSSASEGKFPLRSRPLKRKKHIDSAAKISEPPVAFKELSSQDCLGSYNIEVRIPPPLYPESAFVRKRKPGVITEEAALDALLAIPGVTDNTRYCGESSTSFRLEEFCVYWVHSGKRGELINLPEYVSLQDMFLKPNQRFYFDGTLCAGDRRVFVRHVWFDKVIIGNLERLEAHTVGDDLWIASDRSSNHNVFYRLGNPLPGYRRFHDPFLWNADLAKHAADYLDNHHNVTIHDFRSKFCEWLRTLHGGDEHFSRWLQQYGDTDFIRVMPIQKEFLRSQILSLKDEYNRHPLWAELSCTRFLNTKPSEPGIAPTIVTPYIYDMFKEMWFGTSLKAVKHARSAEISFGSVWSPNLESTSRALNTKGVPTGTIVVGDIVAIEPDERSVTEWKKDNEAFWYLRVTRIEPGRHGRRIHGLWLYASAQTTLSIAKTPFPNEYFLSDHCDSIAESDVRKLVSVTFFPTSSALPDHIFVRQRYCNGDACFQTLQPSHLHCQCDQNVRTEFQQGDTVLVRGIGDLLEPVVVQQATQDLREVRVRRLLRLDTIEDAVPANELLYTDEIIVLPHKDIVRTCQIRCYSDRGRVPAPYSIGGAGHCFYIIQQLTNGSIVPLGHKPEDINEGFDPEQHLAGRLPALDLFCGCGNFAHSVEKSGAIQVKWAVDLDARAMHSYYANTVDHSGVQFFCGSVDDFLLRALQKRKGAPGQGEVLFIIAGSPCQGFSNANQHKENAKSLKNISLLASTAAFVDFYRPKYVFLENVTAMTQTHKPTGQNLFSQLLATFVGMGYQVQQFNLDACTEGAPQSRSRLIIVLTAPGLTMLSSPGLSHGYPHQMQTKSLGRAPNGLPFGERALDADRTFKYVSIASACMDLPANKDGRAPSIAYPDHRPPVYDPYVIHQLMACVPRGLPKLQSAFTAHLRGLVPQYIMQHSLDSWKSQHKNKKDSRFLARVHGDKITPTILANFTPQCAFNGQLVHWYDDRPLSIEEARRAQQFPRSLALFGTPNQRWRLIGNSVPGGLSLALGVSLRQAMDKNRTLDISKGPEPEVRHITIRPALLPKPTNQLLSRLPAAQHISPEPHVRTEESPAPGPVRRSDGMRSSSTPELSNIVDLLTVDSHVSADAVATPAFPRSAGEVEQSRANVRTDSDDIDDDVVFLGSNPIRSAWNSDDTKNSTRHPKAYRAALRSDEDTPMTDCTIHTPDEMVTESSETDSWVTGNDAATASDADDTSPLFLVQSIEGDEDKAE